MSERVIKTDSTKDWHARQDMANAIVVALGAAWHDKAMQDILRRAMVQISPELREGIVEELHHADGDATLFENIQRAKSGGKS